LLLFLPSQVAAFGIFDFLSKEPEQERKSDTDTDVQDFFQDYKLDAQSDMKGKAKIVAINKITASSQILDIKINTPVFFHNLEINLYKCLKVNDPYNPDAYGLFTLTEYKLNDDATVIFQGWLISSSISLSNFDHPIYEVFIKDCL
jgi:hypothetical protein